MKKMLTLVLALLLPVAAAADAYHDTYDGASVLQGFLSYSTGTITASAAMALSSTLAVTGNATFAGDVTLGNAAGDAITITGTPTVATEATFNGEVNLGNAAADSVKVTGAVKLITGVFIGAMDVDGAFTASTIAADNGIDTVYAVTATNVITISGGIITGIADAE